MLATDSFNTMSAGHHHPYAANHPTAHVAEKVMRRVEIAKVARNLQDCLAFASFKAQNGWQNRTLRTIEPEVTEKLKRKRPHTSDDMLSDSSSSTSEDSMHHTSFSSTQTITQKLLQSNRGSRPDTVMEDSYQVSEHTRRKRVRSSSSATKDKASSRSTSWKQDHHLSHSSPIFRRPHTSQGQMEPSFASDAATLPHSGDESSPTFNLQAASDDEDNDLPIHSFQHAQSSSIISSSPPQTPPPTRRHRTDNKKQGGADLLLHFAYSPSRSPAINITSQDPPSTPPSQQTHLPSSVMNTPGIGLFNGALQTPGQNFNFADFVNVTPSPAQLPWGGRTPNMANKTPGASGPSSRATTRRGLNFDQLLPPTGSPNMQRKTPTSQGLALQLGGELMPRS